SAPARVGKGRESVERQFARLTLEAIPNRPRLFATERLHDQIERLAAAVSDLDPPLLRPYVLDELRCKPCHVCYPEGAKGNNLACLPVLPRVGTLGDNSATGKEKLWLIQRRVVVTRRLPSAGRCWFPTTTTPSSSCGPCRRRSSRSA